MVWQKTLSKMAELMKDNMEKAQETHGTTSMQEKKVSK